MHRTVSKLMIPLADFPHLDSKAPLKEAFHLIHGGLTERRGAFGFRNILIVGEDGVVAGTVSMTVLLRGLEPKKLRQHSSNVGGVVVDSSAAAEMFWEGIFAGNFEQTVRRPVADVARPVVATVAPGDSLSRALGLMQAHDAPLLPVVEGNKVVGVIRMVDIFNVIAGMIEETDQPER